MKKTLYIYIPGLGDGYDGFRRFGLWLWSLRPGVQTHLESMHWGDVDETAEQKIDRVKSAIKAAASDTDIVLVGESAGGSIALATYAMNRSRVSRAVTVCGKNIGADRLGASYVRRFKALYHSVELSEELVTQLSPEDLARIRVIYSPLDPTIPKECTVIAGADNQSVRSVGHITTIAGVLLFHFHRISKSIKH